MDSSELKIDTGWADRACAERPSARDRAGVPGRDRCRLVQPCHDRVCPRLQRRWAGL